MGAPLLSQSDGVNNSIGSEKVDRAGHSRPSPIREYGDTTIFMRGAGKRKVPSRPRPNRRTSPPPPPLFLYNQAVGIQTLSCLFHSVRFSVREIVMREDALRLLLC